MILAPIIAKRKNTDDETKEPTLQEAALAGVKPVFVWDESQTDGKPLAELAAVTGNPCSYTDRLTAYVGQLGIVLEYSLDIAPAKGLSHGGKITLLPDLSPAESFSVLVHEVSHLCGVMSYVMTDSRPVTCS